ncbi:hypothetical protein HOLleu_10283 [Holothuria leucospilota]|uniref:Uncharacterized protein n=1 Tax=Holothuria leucospilota TaxID=206669 RepID=A0A9Q1CCV0_HOLLE|nr:hypothetical protein HOLleu_10283 [Holothuria leucospilota]
MEKTFFTRRHDMLLAEFLRITQRTCKGRLRNSVFPYFKIIEKADEEVLSLYREETPKCKNAEELTDLKCITTLVTLPKMLKEEIGNVLVLEDVCTPKEATDRRASHMQRTELFQHSGHSNQN